MRYFDHKQMFCSSFLPLVSVADSFFFFPDSFLKLLWLWRAFSGDVLSPSCRLHLLSAYYRTASSSTHRCGLISMLGLFSNPFFPYLFCCSISPRLTGKCSIKQALVSVWQVPIILEWLFTFWHGSTQGYRLMSSWTKSPNGSQWKQFWWEPRRWDPKMLLMVLLDLKLEQNQRNGPSSINLL